MTTLLNRMRAGPRAEEAPPDPPGADGGALVRIEDLRVSFTRGGSTVPAVRGVSLEIRPGEILGLVGESGSGKSVMALALLGLLPDKPAPDVSGRAVVCGTDMVAASAERRRQVRKHHMGAVFQDPMTSLNPTMRVGRQVAEASGDLDSAVELLRSVGIPDPAARARAYPHELSGGLRQRVMIAMAVAGSPSLVIADEPTTALDVTIQAQILELIRTLCDDLGTSFILVTHDLGVAAQVSDRIGVLYAGRMAELGPAAEIFTTARHPYTHGLLRSRLELDTDRARPVTTLSGEPPDPRHQPPGCAFAPRCPSRTDVCERSLPEMSSLSATSSVACLHPVGIGADPYAGAASVDAWTERPSAVVGGPPPAVLVHGVHKRFGLKKGWKRQDLWALRGIDLSVVKGEAVALVGESGCGKSTLLRAIAGLHGVDEGSIEFGRGARPQMVFQDAGASLTPWLTVGEMIGERLREEKLSRSERKDKVREALAHVGLPAEVAATKPAQLSGGQRQRVALARATVVPPDVLLCDEPTSALDVSLAATVLNLIGRLRHELGMAVLFVTHDLAAARMVADRIAVMYLGRIVEIGTAEDLCSHPAHPYTRTLLETVPGPGRRHVDVKGEPANPLAPPSGCAFHPRCPSATEVCATDTQTLTERVGGEPRAVACWQAWSGPPAGVASGLEGGGDADGGR